MNHIRFPRLNNFLDRLLDNFIAANIGRPGEKPGDPSRTGVITMSTEPIELTLRNFEQYRTDLGALRARVSDFLSSSALKDCEKELREQSVPGNKILEIEPQLTVVLAALRNANDYLLANKLANRNVYDLSPTEISKIFDVFPFYLGYMIHAAEWEMTIPWTTSNAALCDIVQSDILDDSRESFLLQIGKYEKVFAYKSLPWANEEGQFGWELTTYIEELRRYLSLLRSDDPTHQALVGMSLKDFYVGFDNEEEKYFDLLRFYAGIQSPLISSRYLKLPVSTLCLVYALAVALVYALLAYELRNIIGPLRFSVDDAYWNLGLMFVPSCVLSDGRGRVGKLVGSIVSASPFVGAGIFALIFAVPFPNPNVGRNWRVPENEIPIREFVAIHLGNYDPVSRASWWTVMGLSLLLSYYVYHRTLCRRANAAAGQ